MIITSQHQVTNQNGVQSEGSFAISLRNQAHLMTILRDTLYSDKILAVLREYAANAWDAHRQSGRKDTPIRVTLPTQAEPTLVIRDFGTGLSEEDLYQVYTQYGESTKRESNETVGYLGIGSKSAFAYSDSFLITSHYAGVKSVYCAVLDSSDIGEVKRLSQSATDETGLEIRVPVKQQDLNAFVARAQSLFQWFSPHPEINTALTPAKHTFDTPYGGIRPQSGPWIAVMGCVPYRLNLAQVADHLQDANLYTVLQNASGYLRFDLGDVQVNASREELKYGDQTIGAIVRVAEKMIEACYEQVQERVDKETTRWGKLLVQHESRFLSGFARGGSIHADLGDIPLLVRNKATGPSEGKSLVLPLSRHTRVLLKDTRVALKHYDLKAQDTVLGGDIKKGMPLLKKLLGDYEGVPIILLSSLEHAPAVARKPINARLRGKVFVLRDTSLEAYPASSNWDPATELLPDDVWVKIDRFAPCTQHLAHSTFGDVQLNWATIRDDRVMAAYLGVPVPRILGYREGSGDGMSYSEWHTQLWDLAAQNPLIMTETLSRAYTNHWGEWDFTSTVRVVESVCPDAQDPLRVLLTQVVSYPKSVQKRKTFWYLNAKHPLSPASLWTKAIAKYPLLEFVRQLTNIGKVEGFSDYLSLVYQKNLDPVREVN